MRSGWLLAVFLFATGCGATAGNSGGDSESSPVNRRAAILANFRTRIDNYVAVRSKAADDVPDAEVTDDPARLRARQSALAARIRALRVNAKHGDIFSAEIRSLVRRLLIPELKGEQLKEIRDLLKEDAPTPGAIPIEVNAKYPAGAPYTTMTPSILAALPPVPKEIEYRIIGKDLILLDHPADVILDYIRNVIP